MKRIKIPVVLLVTALSITPVFSSYADTQGIFELNTETYPAVPSSNDIFQNALSYNSDSGLNTMGIIAETNDSVEETMEVSVETTESIEETETTAMGTTDKSQADNGPTGTEEYSKTEEELLWELENRAWLEEQLRLQEEALHAQKIGEFFKDSVLVGDSVAEGFSLYAARNTAFPIFQNLKFLTRVSYSVHNAFMGISGKSKHPIYQGEQKYAWDSLRLMGAKHVYTFFGLNDLDAGVNNTVEKYLKYIVRVQQEVPDIKITIVSTTPMYKGSEKKVLNNANIRALNAQMAALAAENGWGYVDVASRLCDSDGCLAKQYCSDKYVHQTNAAYAIWQAAFEEYAKAHLDDEKPETTGEQEELTESQ